VSTAIGQADIINSSMPRKEVTADPLCPADAKALRRRLLTWYRQHQRAMPWRAQPGQTPDAYHVLVSEAMLQQTQVATVIPYFERFIEAMPSVHALADADEQRVLTLWQGLGYYSRARNLHKAARVIVDQFDGQVPTTVEQLLKLPGVGPYTAGAIASIAHGTQAAVVDGNVERVLSRLLLITDPINAPATKKRVWAIAQSLVPRTNPGDYNQALMELGATVCTPKVPKCFVCPLRMQCRGVQEADPQTLPIKLAKKKPKAVTHVVVAIECSGKYLFEQRPADGLWSNMWQLPTWEEPPAEVLNQLKHLENSRRDTSRPADNDTPATARRPRGNAAAISQALIDWFRERFGLTLKQLELAYDFNHQTTHRTIRFVVLHTKVVKRKDRDGTGQWRQLTQLKDLPLSNPQRGVVDFLLQRW